MSASVHEAARNLIEQHGIRAAYMAVERLNQSIDQRDQFGRDYWAQVVHAIHEDQASMKRKKPVRSKAQKSGPELRRTL